MAPNSGSAVESPAPITKAKREIASADEEIDELACELCGFTAERKIIEEVL